MAGKGFCALFDRLTIHLRRNAFAQVQLLQRRFGLASTTWKLRQSFFLLEMTRDAIQEIYPVLFPKPRKRNLFLVVDNSLKYQR